MKRYNLRTVFIAVIALIMLFTNVSIGVCGERLKMSENGNVGIGTDLPAEKLEVNGGVKIGDTATTNAGTIRFNASSQFQGWDGSAWLTFGSEGGEALWSQSGNDIYYNSGNIGIGTTIPGHNLVVMEDFQIGASDITGFSAVNTIYTVAGNKYALAVRNDNTTGHGLAVRGGYDSSHDSLRVTSYDENVVHLLVRGDGNVGIGATNPQKLLQIGSGDNSSLTTQGVYLTSGTANVAFIARDSTKNIEGFWGAFDGGYAEDEVIMGSFTAHDVVLTTSNSERIRIDQGGNVGIGRNNPSYPLHMGSGARVTAGGVWTNASSRKYKENIRDLSFEDALAALEKLTPSRFNYKKDKEDETLGFIAEDVPDLVATKDRKGLSPMDIVAVLTKVVQEQQKKIEQLEAKLQE